MRKFLRKTAYLRQAKGHALPEVRQEAASASASAFRFWPECAGGPNSNSQVNDLCWRHFVFRFFFFIFYFQTWFVKVKADEDAGPLRVWPAAQSGRNQTPKTWKTRKNWQQQKAHIELQELHKYHRNKYEVHWSAFDSWQQPAATRTTDT